MRTNGTSTRARHALAACVVGGVLAVTGAVAQTAKQDAFQRLLRDPGNTELMLTYARLSIEEQDFEAAISTLERLLDVEPANQDARFELALAYFALGQNEVAQFHIDIYRERGQLTAAQQRQAESYVQSIEQRSSSFETGGRVEVGAIHRREESDIGLTFDLTLSGDLDFGDARGTRWDTDLAISALRFPENSFDDQISVFLRTGPVISLDGDVVGAQIRPFVEVLNISTDDEFNGGTTYGFGVEYSNVINASVAVNGEFVVGTADRDSPAFDSDFTAIQIGGQYRPSQELGFLGSVRYLDEDEEEGGLDVETTGLSLGVSRDFDSAFLGVGKSWSLSGFVRQDWSSFADGRDDRTLGAGASLLTSLNDTTFIRTSVRGFETSSSDADFEDSNVLVTMEVGMEF